MHVVAGEEVDRLLRLTRRGLVRAQERAQLAQVEDGADVAEEGVVALAGEGLPAAGQVFDGLLRDGLVVRGGDGADVVGREDGVLDERRAHAVADLEQVVPLPVVVVLVVERGDLTGGVEDRVRVLDVVAEAPLVGDVLDGVAVVVDVDRVEHVLAEPVEDRAGGGVLRRDPVGDERDRVGVVRAHERVDVGVVGGGVLRDERGLAVARGVDARDDREPHGTGEAERQCGAAPAGPGERETWHVRMNLLQRTDVRGCACSRRHAAGVRVRPDREVSGVPGQVRPGAAGRCHG